MRLQIVKRRLENQAPIQRLPYQYGQWYRWLGWDRERGLSPEAQGARTVSPSCLTHSDATETLVLGPPTWNSGQFCEHKVNKNAWYCLIWSEPVHASMEPMERPWTMEDHRCGDVWKISSSLTHILLYFSVITVMKGNESQNWFHERYLESVKTNESFTLYC